MSPFEQFSAEIKQIAELHSISWIARLSCRIEYWKRRYIKNQPLPFWWVRSEGEPVGQPIEIYHLRLHDMMEHEARGQMTEKVLLGGLCANAFSVVQFDQLDDMHARTTIQPRWV